MIRGIKYFSIFLIAVLSLKANAQEDPLKYYTEVKSVFADIQEKSWDYTSSAAHGRSSSRVEEKRKAVTESIETGLVRIFELPPIDGSTALRDSALRFLKMQYAVSNEDFSRLVNMEKVAEQSHDAIEAYMQARDLANIATRQSGEMFNNEFVKFVNAHNITPAPESETEKKLAIAGNVYSHYNQLYRVFFSCYKQESYLIEAMKKDDVSGIEQNRDALIKASEQGLADLMFINSFKEDPELKQTLERVLLFYKDEAENKLKDISLFFVATDNFQKILLSYNNSAAAEHSVEESMLFNKALSEHKITTDNFLKLSAQLDKERNHVISDWHRACEKFIKKHIPKS